MSTFIPWQGFFNFLIFIKPRYSAARRDFPSFSRCWALAKAIWNPLMKPQRSDATTRRILLPPENRAHADAGKKCKRVPDSSEVADGVETSGASSSECCGHKPGVDDTTTSYLEVSQSLATDQHDTIDEMREMVDTNIPDDVVSPRLNKFRLSVARMGFQL
jgi:hypothetical protein